MINLFFQFNKSIRLNNDNYKKDKHFQVNVSKCAYYISKSLAYYISKSLAYFREKKSCVKYVYTIKICLAFQRT